VPKRCFYYLPWACLAYAATGVPQRSVYLSPWACLKFAATRSLSVVVMYLPCMIGIFHAFTWEFKGTHTHPDNHDFASTIALPLGTHALRPQISMAARRQYSGLLRMQRLDSLDVSHTQTPIQPLFCNTHRHPYNHDFANIALKPQISIAPRRQCSGLLRVQRHDSFDVSWRVTDAPCMACRSLMCRLAVTSPIFF
jgi:hypothetical protein